MTVPTTVCPVLLVHTITQPAGPATFHSPYQHTHMMKLVPAEQTGTMELSRQHVENADENDVERPQH